MNCCCVLATLEKITALGKIVVVREIMKFIPKKNNKQKEKENKVDVF